MPTASNTCKHRRTVWPPLSLPALCQKSISTSEAGTLERIDSTHSMKSLDWTVLTLRINPATTSTLLGFCEHIWANANRPGFGTGHQ